MHMVRDTFLYAMDSSPQTLSALDKYKQPVVAASYRHFRAVEAAGFEAVDLLATFSESDLQDQLEVVWQVWQRYDAYLEQLDLPVEERSLLRLRGLQCITVYQRIIAIADVLSAAPLIVRNGRVLPFSMDLPFPDSASTYDKQLPRGPRWAGSAVPFLPFSRHVVLDARSSRWDAERTVDEQITVRLEFSNGHQSAFLRLHQLFRLLHLRVIRKPLLRCDLPQATIWPELQATIDRIPDPAGAEANDQIDNVLGRLTRNLVLDTRRLASVVEDFALRHTPQIELLRLDFVADPLTAALVGAFRNTPTPVSLESHGNMVEHGTGTRRAIAGLICDNGFNDHPSVDFSVPQSKYQRPNRRSWRKVIKRSPIVERRPVETRSNDQFRILLAPNFILWPQAYPAMTTSCIECGAIVEFVANALAGDSDFELAIRVKTTGADQSTENSLRVDRGFHVDNVQHLFSLADNIVDSNLGSYSAALRRADLVITEGISKVVYEALEHRKPVVLLNWSTERTPSVPSVAFHEVLADEQRHPIYQAACDEKLVPFLRTIKSLHHSDTLTDDELASALWVEASRTNSLLGAVKEQQNS